MRLCYAQHPSRFRPAVQRVRQDCVLNAKRLHLRFEVERKKVPVKRIQACLLPAVTQSTEHPRQVVGRKYVGNVPVVLMRVDLAQVPTLGQRPEMSRLRLQASCSLIARIREVALASFRYDVSSLRLMPPDPVAPLRRESLGARESRRF